MISFSNNILYMTTISRLPKTTEYSNSFMHKINIRRRYKSEHLNRAVEGAGIVDINSNIIFDLQILQEVYYI